MNDLLLVDEIDKIDFQRVTQLLSQTYWSPGITREEVRFGAENFTLVVGAYRQKELVGYMRVLSDRVRFAYLMDVIVDPSCRRQGIGQAMVRFARNHERLKWVYRWLLTTQDAHGVYAKTGFMPLEDGERWMTISQARPSRPVFPPEK